MSLFIEPTKYLKEELSSQNKLVDYFLELLEVMPERAYICGGAAAFMAGLTSSLDGDIDFYFLDQFAFDDMRQILEESKYSQLIGDSENATNYSVLGKTVQLVHPVVANGSIEDVLNTFDINFARVGVVVGKDGSHNLYKDININTNVIYTYESAIRHPVKTAFRLAKYARKFPNATLPISEFTKVMHFWSQVPEEQQYDFLNTASLEYDKA